MKHFNLLIDLVIITLCCFSCSSKNPAEDDSDTTIHKPIVQLVENWEGISDTTATLKGLIVDDGNDEDIVYGFIVYPYEEEIRREYDEMKVYCEAKKDAEGEFRCNVKGLLSGISYEYKAFAENKAGYTESGTTTFRTSGPTISVKRYKPAYEEDVVLHIYIENKSGILNKWGICWGTSPKPTIEKNSNKIWNSSNWSEFHLYGLEKGTKYYARAFAYIDNVCRYGVELSFTTMSKWKCDYPAGQMVDLGLSVKWADRNIGAYSSSALGDYFAWGETSPKAGYELANYKYYPKNSTADWQSYVPTKYNEEDSNVTLLAEDDAASVVWENGWRMPTYNEMDELIKNCTITETTNDGVEGWLCTSKKNGNYIFLPKNNDYNCYWSASVATPYIRNSWAIEWQYNDQMVLRGHTRCQSSSIRPVHD